MVKITVISGADSVIGPLLKGMFRKTKFKIFSLYEEAQNEGLDPNNLTPEQKLIILDKLIKKAQQGIRNTVILVSDDIDECKVLLGQYPDVRLYSSFTRVVKGWSIN